MDLAFVAKTPRIATSRSSTAGLSVIFSAIAFPTIPSLDPAMLGQRFGRAMLGAYLRDVAFPLFPDEHRCFIAHEVENHAAIACSRAVGFEMVGPFVEEGFPSFLFVLCRDKWAESRG